MNTSITIRKRIGIIFICAACALGLLLVRLAWVQFVWGDDLQKKAFINRTRSLEIKAKRGNLYDRNGEVLAMSVSTDSFFAVPAEVRKSERSEEIATILAKKLDLDQEKLLKDITKRSSFAWIKRKVDSELAKEIKQLDLPGIHSVEEPKRYYPNGMLASHILGFTGIDNDGLNGIEITYENELAGLSGRLRMEYDNAGRELPDSVQEYISPSDGNSLVLTIDKTIQYIAERELDTAMKVKQAKRASILVMDPKTGDILALANRPAYDPNFYGKFDQSTWRNAAISDAYEPGSTFKPVTVAGALDEGIVRTTDRFYDPGFIKVGKEVIKCWRSHNPHGSQNLIEGVQNSCNPVFVSIGLKEGTETFYKYLYGFGYGKKTGIELPGEASGILVPKKRAKEIDLATMSIGQANAVTPIQLISATSAIVNDGWLMKPRLVKEIRDKDGNLVTEIKPEKINQVISKETSAVMREILETVVSEGTGKNAYIEGYRVGGKTGTAQKIIPGGGYSTTDYIGSFIGVAPSNDPELVALVIVDSPKGIYYGGSVAAPVFKNVIRDSLRYLQVAPQLDPTTVKVNVEKVKVPNLENNKIGDAKNELKKLKLKYQIIGQGNDVKVQLPAAGTEIEVGTSILLYTTIPGAKEEVIVPDLKGMTIRQAGEVLNLLGLELQVQGSGLAVEQLPTPGSKTTTGDIIKVKFVPPSGDKAIEVISP